MTTAAQKQRRLPVQFEELEPFVDRWAGMTTAERMTARCESSMEEIQAYYDAVLQRADEALDLIEQYPLEGLPEDVGTLFRLVLGLAQASIAVELYQQPRAPETPYPNSIRLVRGTAPYG